MLAVVILTVGILFRLIDHMPNFTPIIALSLFGAWFLPRRWAVVTPLMMLIFSDLLIGFHATIPYTWGSVVVISLLATTQVKSLSAGSVLAQSVLASVLFFIVTNFGVWLVYHPLTIAGLVDCYTLAVPFFRTTLISTTAYSFVFYYAHRLIHQAIKVQTVSIGSNKVKI